MLQFLLFSLNTRNILFANREEKTAVKNAAMLTGFLRDMVYTKLIIQQNDNEKLETVNNQEVSALKRKADKLLKNI